MADRVPTFTEEARRRQIVDRTIGLVAERMPGAASLSAIAARAGISRAAVLYHFATKDAVLDATARHVVVSLAAAVGERVDAAEEPEAMLVAVGHLREHPVQVRVLAAGLVRDRDGASEHTSGSAAGSAGRWQGVARILELGRRDGVFRRFDTRVMALMINGALDGMVAEWVRDPGLDLDEAAAELERVLLAVRSRS